MKETIEKLKNNLAWYENLSCEERATLKKVGKENCEWLSCTGEWETPSQLNFEDEVRYRIKPDYVYQEESEYEEYEIKAVNNEYRIMFLSGNGSMKLSEALNDPSFAGVQFAEQQDNTRWSMMLRAYVNEDGTFLYATNHIENLVLTIPSKIRFKK